MTTDLLQDYRSAEVTLFWAGGSDTGEGCLVFATTELIPENQLQSPPLGVGEKTYLSHRLSKRMKIFCKRFYCTVAEAVDCYEKADWSPLDTSLSLQMGENVKREPQRGYALVVSRSHVVLGQWASNLSMVLPNRETSLRACAYVERDETLKESFSKGELSGIAVFVRRYCGVDLEAYGEFLGASILCMQDPLLWGIKSFGTDRNGNLNLLLLPRDGKSPIGMRYMLHAQHTFGEANAELKEVDSEIISFPWSADRTVPELYLWDKNGSLLEVKTLSFIDVGAVRTTMEHRELPNGKSMPVFPQQRSSAKKQKELMEQYEKQRMYRRLEERGEFFYFKARESERAINIIGMLLARTEGEITICDMFLDSVGLERMVRGWIKCRKLTMFTSKYWMNNKGGTPREPDLINSIQKIYEEKRAEQISLYVLSGGNYNKGIIHDRFLILDEMVYCLGSSLNGFGTRDTVLFRSPNPDAFIKRVTEWEKNRAPKVWKPKEGGYNI